MNEDSPNAREVDPLKNPVAPVPLYFNAEPTPLSRPLILFAIGLFLNVSSVLYQLKRYFEFMGTPTWDLTINSGPYFIPIMEPLLYLALIVKSVALLAALALLILMARRSWFFIKWVLAYLSASMFLQVVEIGAAVYLNSAFAARELGKPPDLGPPWGFIIVPGSVVVTLIWMAYFIFSNRVKKTFVD